jgi:hypothetical protein
MKKLLLFPLLAFSNLLVLGQKTDTSFICVIGTSHNNTIFCNVQTLDSILNLIKPDLILEELDSSFFTSDLRYDTLNYTSILHGPESSPTDIASINYQKSHNVDIRPFDITGRNRFYRENDFFNKQNEMIKDIYRHSLNNSLSKRNQSDFNLWIKSLDNVNDLKISNLKELNSEILMNFLEIQESIYLDKPIEIVETTDSLNKYIEFAHLQKDFWIKRNDTMIKNILYFAHYYKRIIIFTGNLHKYYLTNGLRIPEGPYKIKEFWEF